MAAGATIKHKRKAGAFANGDLAAGEWGLDVTNSVWYYSINGTTVVQLAAGVTTLNGLTDVTLGGQALADNHLLAYDTATSQWINQTAAQAGIVASSEKGAASGVAPLDGSSKIDVSYLPSTVVGAVEYQGTWNATTNSPNLGGLTPGKGDYYVVSVGGATSLGGITDWAVGDWAIYNGAAWQKVDNSEAVSSVFNRTGAVVAALSDYDASQIDNDSTVSGATVAAALNSTKNASNIDAGDLGAARMQTNLAAALNAIAAATVNNANLTIDGGTI